MSSPKVFDSPLQRVMLTFQEAFQVLSVENIDPLKIEQLSCLIYQVMSGRERRYHVMPHLFQMIEGAQPGVETLSILFHDLIYIHVDKRIHPLTKPYLKEFLTETSHSPCVLPSFKNDPILDLVGKIFGVVSGQTLTTTTGENEFLSAVVAARILQGILRPWDLIQVIACIEATIPFRLDPSEQLYNNMKTVVEEQDLEVTETHLRKALESVVNVANLDVLGFYSHDLGLFLGQTWLLILEGQPIFRNPLYTIKQYRKSLQKMEEFFLKLDPHLIPRRYKNYPHPDRYNEILSYTERNLVCAAEYIQAKLLATSLLEAITDLTGGDTPMSLILGDDSQSQAPIERFFDSLLPSYPEDKLTETFLVLKFGRATPSSFDFRHAPLSIYLYEHLTRKEYDSLLSYGRKFCLGLLGAQEYLQFFPKRILRSILIGIAKISWSRSAGIQNLLKDLGLKYNVQP